MKRKIQFIGLIFNFFLATNLSAQSVVYSSLYDNSTFGKSIDLSKPVGSLDGNAGTSPSGGVTYTVPIKLPPGTNGMMPNLSLVYNSQGGNGILGQGWSISGLSAITRAGKDIYHNGVVTPVSYTNDDAFVLDGSRLSVKTLTNGADLATYRTEEESFSVITSYGTTGDGPSYFNVVTKEGLLMQFGNSPDSKVMSDDGNKVMLWRINKILDKNGNYIWFTYENSDRNFRIKEIRYTGNENTGLQPYNVITFNYSTRDDKNTAYDNGFSVKADYLLTSIIIQELSTSETFKNYSFWYGKNNSVSFLKTIYELNGSGESLNDTRFKYGENVDEVSFGKSNIDIKWARSSTAENSDIFAGDFDGDGKTEILTAHYKYNSSSTNVFDRNYYNFMVYKQNGSPDNYSIMPSSSTSWSSNGKYLVSFNNKNGESKSKNFVSTDFDGDGRDDLLFTNITSDNLFGGVSIYYSRLGTASPGFDKVDIAPASLPGTHQMKGENIILLGDFDGDKRADYMYMTRHEETSGLAFNHTFVSFPGKGENNQPIMLESNPSLYDQSATQNIRNASAAGVTSKVYVVDFDGDGISEIMCSLTDGNIIYKLAKNSSGVYYFKTLVWMDGYPTERYQDIKGIGDFNGDGKDDFIVNSKATRSYWEIAYSTGKGFSVSPFIFTSGSEFQSECKWKEEGGWFKTPTTAIIADGLYIGDYNGDGKSDILHRRKYCTTDYDNEHKTDFIFYYFIGKKTATLGNMYEIHSFTYPYSLSDIVTPILTDVNGDGKNEFSFKRASLSGVADADLVHTLYFRKDCKNHLLEKVTDGFNRTTEFNYEPLTKSSGSGDFYIKGSGETYPINNGQYPLYVVTSVKAPNGIGGINTTNYSYENLRLHRAGKGLLGFEKIKNHNVNSDIRSETIYSLSKHSYSGRDFYTFNPQTTKTFLNSSGSQLNQTDYTYTFERIGSDFCFLQRNTSTVISDFLKGVITTSTNTIDGDGNLTYTSSNTTGGPEDFSSSTTTTYQHTAGSPIPNKPEFSITTTKRGANPAVSTKKTTYYDSKGNLITLSNRPEPLSVSGIYLVSNTFQYDLYGNVVKEEIKPLGATYFPFTEYIYDDFGRFPIKKWKNAGDVEETAYHKFWGKPTSIKGIDGFVTTNTYDQWGKLTSTYVPFGPTSGKTITYSDDWEVDIPSKQLYYSLTHDPLLPDLKVGYDLMGRSVRTQKETFGTGNWVTSLTTYDTKGNLSTSTNNFLPAETPIITTNTYDELNRIKTASNVFGTTLYNYSSGSGISTTTITLPDGKIKVSKVDALGKIIESSNGIAGTVLYTYDSRGNETRLEMRIFSSASHTFITKEYNTLGQLIKMNDQDAGETSYKYDPLGRLIEEKSPSLKTTYFKYDDFGKLIEKKIDGYETKYLYTDKLQNYSVSQIQTIGPEGTITDGYEYEYGGRLKRHTRTTGSFVMKKDFGYDGNNRMILTNYFPSNFSTFSDYDANGYLTKIRENTGPTVTYSKVLYECLAMNGNEQVTKYKRADGLEANIEFDKGFAKRYLTTGSYGTKIQDLSMTYNYANGNVMSRTDNVTNTNEVFEYDAVDRLTKSQASKTGPGAVSHAALDIQYDSHMWNGSFGQIVSKSDVGTYAYSGFPKNAVKAIDVASSTVISHLTQDIEYNVFDMPKKITETVGGIPYQQNFIYNGNEERTYTEQLRSGAIKRKRWYMNDYEIDNNIVTGKTNHIHYIYGDAGLCGIVRKEGSTYNFYAAYTDHLGSIVTVTEETGGILPDPIAKQSYDPWGRVRNPDTWGYSMTGAAPIPDWLYRGYTGHEMMPEYGLINMNARLYDPANGRMLRPDNELAYPENTQSYNRYSYAMNNPMTYIDPDGNNPLVAAVVIGAAISASVYTYSVARSDGGFDNWNWGKFTFSALSGALSGAISYGIGSAFSATGSVLNEVGRAAAHGATSYILSGGEINALYSGSLGSLGGSLGNLVGGPLNTTIGGTIFSAGLSGAGAAINGGNFWEGAAIGATIHLTNYIVHEARDIIITKAMKHLGSTKYAYDASIDDFGEGTNKCNKYVNDVLEEAGVSPGLPNGNSVKKSLGFGSPTTAGQWADPKYKVPGWKIVKSPRGGDVVGIKGDFSDATGHVAIMVSPQVSIGAGSSNVHLTYFGYSKSYYKSFPGNNGYVYRRYVGR